MQEEMKNNEKKKHITEKKTNNRNSLNKTN